MSCAARLPLDAPRRTRLLPAPAVASSCPASPHCDVPERLAGLDLMGAWWLHLGPIGRRSTRVALHPHGDPADGDRPAASVETRPEHRPFAGCRVDYLCLPASPGVTPLVRTIDGLPAGLAPVYAVGWRDQDGPSVTLSLAGAAPSPLRWRFPGEASTGSMVAELERLEALLLGHGRGRGRPRREQSGDWRALALRAEQLQAEHPGITQAQLARVLGIGVRTVRLYARLLANERATDDIAERSARVIERSLRAVARSRRLLDRVVAPPPRGGDG